MIEFINNPWYVALLVMITQFIFLYLRTLNVIYVAEKLVIPALITGTLISACWLITVTFSMNAMINLHWQPIAGYLIGGLLGTWRALLYNKKQN